MTDFRLFTDRTMCVAGPSQAGKSSFVVSLLEHSADMFRKPIKRVRWYYGILQPKFHFDLREKGYIVSEGLPKPDDDIRAGDLIVLDDLLQESKASKHVTEMFLRSGNIVWYSG